LAEEDLVSSALGIVSGEPDDLFFSDIVASYRNAPRFQPRDWLARRLNAHLDEPACRFVLLVAEPGAGKSTFIANLASVHRDWPVFFIRRDQRSSIGEVSTRSVLLRIGLELAALHPELFELDQVRVEVEQRIGETRAEVVGAEIERIRASPFHQTVLRIRQEIQQSGGSVAGLRIKEWIADPRLMGIEDLQELALFRPARILNRLRPEKVIVVLIDALDEVRHHDQEQNVIEWLANCPPLPENVRMVLTSRPSRDLALFQEKRRDSLALLPILPDDPDVQADTEIYAHALLNPVEISTALLNAGRSPDAFVVELVAKADGNIGYLAALGRAFDQALASTERQSLLKGLLGLERLPDDLAGLFAFFLHSIQNCPGRKDVKVSDSTGRAGLVQAWAETYHPILAVLAVAVEPLTLDQIHALTGKLADRTQVAQTLEWLDQFLDRVGNTYRLYHNTLGEFLTAQTTLTNAQTSDLYVDARAENRRLADLLAREAPDVIWQDSPDLREQGRRDYARRHYIKHLYLGNDWDRVYSTIDEGRYGQGKLRFDRSSFLYSQDLDLAIHAVTREEPVGKGLRLGRLSRLWRYKLLHNTLSSYADDFPPSSYRALALAKGHRDAADLAELISAAPQQALAFSEISAALAAPEQSEQAATLLRRAYEIGLRIEQADQRRAILRRLLDVSGRFFGVAFRPGERVRKAAVALAFSFQDAVERAEALASVCRLLQQAGQTGQAAALRTEVRDLAFTPTDREPAALLLGTHSTLCADLGDFFEAYSEARKIVYLGNRLDALVHLIGCQHRTGAHRAAEGVLARVEEIAVAAPPGTFRARALIALAQARLASGRATQAPPLLAEALNEPRSNSDVEEIKALLAIARGFREAGAPLDFANAVRIVWESALAHISHSDQTYTMNVVAQEAALGLARLQQHDQALDIAGKLHDYERGSILQAVGDGFASQGQWDRALAAAEQIRQARSGPVWTSRSRDPIENYWEDSQLLISISTALSRDQQADRALEVAERIAEAKARLDALSRIAVLQFETGSPDRARSLVARMEHEVRLGYLAAGRDDALSSVVKLLILGEQHPRAREIARSIQSPSERARAQSTVIESLIAAGDITDPEQVLEETAFARVRGECLLSLAKKMKATAIDNSIVIRTLISAREHVNQEKNLTQRAESLRSIAVAFAELCTGAVNHALDTAMAVVDALNAAPRFGFVPTPWCDTAVTFAKLGHWNIAMQIANSLIAHDVFDGSSALLALAGQARKDCDRSGAEALLVQARRHAPHIHVSMQSDVLAKVAKEYALLGKPNEATKDEFLMSKVGQGPIAVGLAESGRIEEAAARIEAAGTNLSDFARSSLIDAFVNAGDLTRALSTAQSMHDGSTRAEKLVSIASRFVRSGQPDEAHRMISAAMAPTKFYSSFSRTSFLKGVITVLTDAGDSAGAARIVEQEWLMASSRSDLLYLVPVVAPLIPLQPDIAVEIASSFDWVEHNVLAV